MDTLLHRFGSIISQKLLLKQQKSMQIKNSGTGIIYIRSINTWKEELAHTRQKETNKKEGLIGVRSCVENTCKRTF